VDYFRLLIYFISWGLRFETSSLSLRLPAWALLHEPNVNNVVERELTSVGLLPNGGASVGGIGDVEI
jgi:hypothetical protein